MNRKYYGKYLENVKRPNGDTFVRKTDNTPIEFDNLIYDIHKSNFFGAMPNDWIYEIIKEAFEYMEGIDIDEDTDVSDMNIESDIYDIDLYEWMKNNGYAQDYCDEYQDEFHVDGQVKQLVRGGQWLAKKKIYEEVLEFIREEETENERRYEGE
jgi:hypothetical protein